MRWKLVSVMHGGRVRADTSSTSAAGRDHRRTARCASTTFCGNSEPRPAQHRKRQQDRILRHPVEHERRDQPRRDAADHAAGRHPEVEAGEVARRRAPSRQFAMAHQRADEEHHEMDRDQPDDGLERLEHDHGDEADDEQRLDIDDEPMRNDRPAGEHDDEGQEIERERQHPEQRHRRDVGRDVGGDRDQQAGRHGRERHPGRGIAPGRRRGGVRVLLRRGLGQPCGRAPQQRAAARDQRRREPDSRATTAGPGRQDE